MKSLKISETSLFKKLCAWGLAQVSNNKEEARAKVDDCLKFIRFCGMDYAEFSHLCHKDAALNLLNSEEKYQIFLSITQKNSDLLPVGFSKEKNPRFLDRCSEYDWLENKDSDCTVDNLEPVNLTVTVGKTHYLTGVQLYSLTDINAGKLVHLTCCVYSMENPKLCIISATFNGIVKREGSENLNFDSPVLMKKGICYRITVTYLHEEELPTAIFVIEDNCMTWSDEEDVEFAVTFYPDNKSGPPIIDICGLKLAEYVP